MSKQCDECGTLSDNDAAYCEACGGRAWHVPVRTWARIRQTTTVVLVMAFAGAVVWLALSRH